MSQSFYSLPHCGFIPRNSKNSCCDQLTRLSFTRKRSRVAAASSPFPSCSSVLSAIVATTCRAHMIASGGGDQVCANSRGSPAAKSSAIQASSQSLQFPSPWPAQMNGDASSPSGGKPMAILNEKSLRLVGDGDRAQTPFTDPARTAAERGVQTGERNGNYSGSSLPSMEDIVTAAAQHGVILELKSLGPSFEIVVSGVDEDKVFGKAIGWIKVWTKGRILHLEKVALDPELTKRIGNLLGAGFFVGASTLRYGLDQGCRTAELLAIRDDEATHAKLVKYYSRLGFKPLYEVGEEDWKHIPDRIVWGGVGTRMDADCEELLRRWSKFLKPKLKSKSEQV